LKLLIFFLLLSTVAFSQEKGVDSQAERIRDIGTERDAGHNGAKQDVGTGRGIDFGKGKTPQRIILPNPYKLNVRRDVVTKAVEDLFSERKLTRDSSSTQADRMVVSQPFTFTKGAVVSQPELNRVANVPASNASGWTRGRYTYVIEIQPVDSVSTNVTVNAKVEGRTDSPFGAEWVTVPSNGTLEQEFLRDLIEKITGSAPPDFIE
jgi:hypothetical protein